MQILKIHENDNYCVLTVIDGDYDVVFAIGKNDFLILRRRIFFDLDKASPAWYNLFIKLMSFSR